MDTFECHECGKRKPLPGRLDLDGSIDGTPGSPTPSVATAAAVAAVTAALDPASSTHVRASGYVPHQPHMHQLLFSRQDRRQVEDSFVLLPPETAQKRVATGSDASGGVEGGSSLISRLTTPGPSPDRSAVSRRARSKLPYAFPSELMRHPGGLISGGGGGGAPSSSGHSGVLSPFSGAYGARPRRDARPPIPSRLRSTAGNPGEDGASSSEDRGVRPGLTPPDVAGLPTAASGTPPNPPPPSGSMADPAPSSTTRTSASSERASDPEATNPAAPSGLRLPDSLLISTPGKAPPDKPRTPPRTRKLDDVHSTEPQGSSGAVRRAEDIGLGITDLSGPVCLACVDLVELPLSRRHDFLARARDHHVAFLHQSSPRVTSGDGTTSEPGFSPRKRTGTRPEDTVCPALGLHSAGRGLASLRQAQEEFLEAQMALEARICAVQSQLQAGWEQLVRLTSTAGQTRLKRDACVAEIEQEARKFNTLFESHPLLDAFQIQVHPVFFGVKVDPLPADVLVASINHLRVGCHPEDPTPEWHELTAAWGYVACALNATAEYAGCKFEAADISFNGSYAQITLLEPTYPSTMKLKLHCDEAVFSDDKQALLFDFACGGLLRCLHQLYKDSSTFAKLQAAHPVQGDRRAADVSRGWAPRPTLGESAGLLTSEGLDEPVDAHEPHHPKSAPALQCPFDMSLDFGLVGGQALSLRAGWQSWNIASARMLVNLFVAMEFYCGRRYHLAQS